MTRINYTRYFFKVHSYAGLITGIFLLVIGISGSLLVFREEIDNLLNPSGNFVTPKTERISIDSMYRIIVHRYPRLDNIALVNYPAKPNEAYRFTLYRNDGNINTYDLYHLNINPYDGKILRGGWNRDISRGLMHWIFQLHFSFHWGVPGLLLTALLGIAMMVSVLTGLIIYRKYLWKVITFKVGIHWKNKNTRFSSLHRMVGVWALLFNLVICFTGFWMNKFAFDPAYWKRQSIAASQNIIIQQNIDTLIARALLAQPMQHCYIRIPTISTKPLVINGMLPEQPLLYGSELNTVKTDVINGKIMSTTSYKDATAADKLEALSYPLHVGNYGGWPIKIIYVIVGLTPGFLSVSGFWLWRRKKYKTKI